jgi:hypothetical protein
MGEWVESPPGMRGDSAIRLCMPTRRGNREVQSRSPIEICGFAEPWHHLQPVVKDRIRRLPGRDGVRSRNSDPEGDRKPKKARRWRSLTFRAKHPGDDDVDGGDAVNGRRHRSPSNRETGECPKAPGGGRTYPDLNMGWVAQGAQSCRSHRQAAGVRPHGFCPNEPPVRFPLSSFHRRLRSVAASYLAVLPWPLSHDRRC